MELQACALHSSDKLACCSLPAPPPAAASGSAGPGFHGVGVGVGMDRVSFTARSQLGLPVRRGKVQASCRGRVTVTGEEAL